MSIWRLVLICAVVGCTGASEPSESPWPERADAALESTIESYWSEENQAFRPDRQGLRLQYWWQAHALDVLVDAAERTGDADTIARINALSESVFVLNGSITNDLYDDMLWMAIAQLRAHELTGKASQLENAEVLWEDILTGYNETHGWSFAWSKRQLDYKNVVANAPAAIFALRLYARSGDEADRLLAKELIDWMSVVLVDPSTGEVWDGIGREGGDAIDKDWLFTYTHGVYLGACAAYFLASGERNYLEKAVRTANYAMTRFAPAGVLLDEGADDGGLFRGIFIRYLAGLSRVADLDAVMRRKIEDFILENAEAAWQNSYQSDGTIYFGEDWSKPAPAQLPDLSVQLSGLMLLEQASRITD